jgi:hypothetical protein
MTPLHLAAEEGAAPVVELLLTARPSLPPAALAHSPGGGLSIAARPIPPPCDAESRVRFALAEGGGLLACSG